MDKRRLFRDSLRASLRALEFLSLKAANRGIVNARLRAGVDDLLKARRIASLCDDASSILDVGCGNGHRLSELSLFLSKSVRLMGVDVAERQPPNIPEARPPEFTAFDGKKLPLDDQSFDVVMICYVLHHLHPRHAHELLLEATRVARHKLILLEDTMTSWSLPYRLRNWAHLTESNLQYGAESEDFVEHFGIEGFLTLDEWKSALSKLPRTQSIRVDELTSIKRYAHHHLIEVTLCAS